MKLFPLNFLLWSSLLGLWVLQSGTNGNSAVICQEDIEESALHVQTPTESHFLEESDGNETFVCLLHPSDVLNCSWSFHTLEKDSQVLVHIRVCNGDVERQSLQEEFVERDASATFDITDFEMISVVLHVNKSLRNDWTAYTRVFDKNTLDFLSPPPRINASVKENDLIVSWDLPCSQFTYGSRCFQYQLDMGGQYKTIDGKQWYTKENVDLTDTYRLRMRARINMNECIGCTEWSNWSHTVTVEGSVYTPKHLVAILLTLGIHLMLAVLLLLYHRRLLNLLFPPIPRPPPKYKYFLEASDTFNFFYPAVPAKSEEEITEVEDIEKSPLNMS